MSGTRFGSARSVRLCAALAALALLSSGVSASARGAVLMSYWPMDDGTGSTTAADIAGSRDGTLTNMDAASDWVTGQSGSAGDYALDLDGSNDWVEIGQLIELNFGKSTPFSVSAWVYDRGGSTAGVVSALNPGSPYDGWGLNRVSGPAMRLEITSTNGAVLKADAATTHATNQWVYVTATYDGSDDASGIKLYLNGSAVATTVVANTAGGVPPTNRTVALSSYGGANRYFNGQLDEVAIWGEPLSAAEVKQLAAGASPLDILWQPLDIRGSFNADTIATSTSDSSGTGYRGTLNEKFLVGSQFPADGLLIPEASGGSGPVFEFGPYDGDNTVRMDSGGSVSIDVENGTYSEISVLHSAVGFNTNYGTQNGTITLHYADGTSEVVMWDVADNDGNNGDGLSDDALTGLTLYRFGGSGGSWGNRQLWYQTLTVDRNKWLDSIDFSVSGVTDGDADFGIYAVSGLAAVPEPGAGLLLAIGLIGLAAGCRRRRAGTCG